MKNAKFKTDALETEAITPGEAEDLEVYELKDALGVSVEVTYNVSIG